MWESGAPTRALYMRVHFLNAVQLPSITSKHSRSMATSSTATAAAAAVGPSSSSSATPIEYRYLQEISQMMFVFGDVVDATPDVLKLVEDIVRNQVIEMLLQSRALAARRASRYLSPEDLLFLIRYDRAKVNRLRTYLSWKDVRKNAKDSGGDAAGNAADVGDAPDDGVDNPIRSRKMKIKLPWEISTVFSEFLGGPGGEDVEEEDEDDIEAHQDSLQRLKDADEATRRMTRDEYVHYSECRQASFTFRKSKKFREFINAGAYLDIKPNDDIIDVLGFLAFEVVRELCVGAVALKQSFEAEAAHAKRLAGGSRSRRDAVESGGGQPAEAITSTAVVATDTSATTTTTAEADANGGGKRKRASSSTTTSPSKRTQGALDKDKAADAGDADGKDDDDADGDDNSDAASSAPSESACGLFTVPPAKSSPLMTSHVREAFARLQRGRSSLATGGGGTSGGLKRTRVFVI